MIKSLILTLVIIAIVISFDFGKFEFNFGYLLYFVHLPSLLLIVIPPVGLTIGNFSWETYKKTWSIPFGNPENFEQSELIETHKCVKYMGNMFVIMGLMPFLIFFGGIIEVARIILGKDRPKWLPKIYWPVSAALSIAGLPSLLTFLFI